MVVSGMMIVAVSFVVGGSVVDTTVEVSTTSLYTLVVAVK